MQATLKTCRTVVQFENPAAFDLMSYGMLSIKGTAAKPITLALLDTIGQEVPLVRLSGPFDQRIKLTPLMRGLDPPCRSGHDRGGEQRRHYLHDRAFSVGTDASSFGGLAKKRILGVGFIEAPLPIQKR